MDNKLVAFEAHGIVITEEEKRVIVQAISSQKPTDAELKVYFYDCARRGVHPLDHLIHFTKRNDRYTPVVSIDYMRIRAESSGTYAGSDDAAFEGGDKYPISARVTVWKLVGGQRCPFTATARWAEYAPADLGDKSAFMWRKMPHTMLGKCAESLALRKAFPGQLSGLYGGEEMDQAEPIINGEMKVPPEPMPEKEKQPKIPAQEASIELPRWTGKTPAEADVIFQIKKEMILPEKQNHPAHIMNILNKLIVCPTDAPDVIFKCFRIYVEARKRGLESDAAVMEANATYMGAVVKEVTDEGG